MRPRRTLGSAPGTGLALAAADLVLGAACPGCGEASRAVCPRCLVELRPLLITVDERPVRILAAGEHDGVLERCVLAGKERPAPALTPVLAHLVAAAVCALVGEADTVTLIPVPASRRSRRSRGGDLVEGLSVQSAGLLRAVGVRTTVTRGLQMVRQTRDQRGLGVSERAENLAGAFRAIPRDEPPDGAVQVLVDDVVTTGATLAEAIRALSADGVSLAGAAVVSRRR